jgi:hypothetical protein
MHLLPPRAASQGTGLSGHRGARAGHGRGEHARRTASASSCHRRCGQPGDGWTQRPAMGVSSVAIEAPQPSMGGASVADGQERGGRDTSQRPPRSASLEVQVVRKRLTRAHLQVGRTKVGQLLYLLILSKGYKSRFMSCLCAEKRQR